MSDNKRKITTNACMGLRTLKKQHRYFWSVGDYEEEISFELYLALGEFEDTGRRELKKFNAFKPIKKGTKVVPHSKTETAGGNRGLESSAAWQKAIEEGQPYLIVSKEAKHPDHEKYLLDTFDSGTGDYFMRSDFKLYKKPHLLGCCENEDRGNDGQCKGCGDILF